MINLDPTATMLLGALISLVCTLLAGAAVFALIGGWLRTWLSGFDDLGAKREGGKLRMTAVLVDKARPVRRPKEARTATVRPLPAARRAEGDD